MDEQQFQRELASYKQEQDFLKHLTTLNTGSILLMVTFLEKLFQNPQGQLLIWIAFISFGASIIGCITIHFLSVISIDSTSERKVPGGLFFNLLILILAFGGFLTGLISLITFALINIT